MNPERSLPPVVDWFINLVATYGIWIVIAVGTVAILAGCCIAGLTWHLIERHRERRADARRKQDDLENQDDLDTCNAIWHLPSPRKETP